MFKFLKRLLSKVLKKDRMTNTELTTLKNKLHALSKNIEKCSRLDENPYKLQHHAIKGLVPILIENIEEMKELNNQRGKNNQKYNRLNK